MPGSSQLFALEDDIPMLLGVECSRCHLTWFPRVLLGCERCGSYGDDLTPRTFSSAGRLISSAEIKQVDGQYFTLASIALEDGPVIRAILDDEVPVSINDTVRASVIEDGDELAIRLHKR